MNAKIILKGKIIIGWIRTSYWCAGEKQIPEPMTRKNLLNTFYLEQFIFKCVIWLMFLYWKIGILKDETELHMMLHVRGKKMEKLCRIT